MSTGWRTRKEAIKVLCAFEVDKRLREHLEPVLVKFPNQDRAFIKETVSGTVRYLKLLDFSIERATEKRLGKQSCIVRNGLRLIAYQLFFTGVPAYAAVNEVVEAVKRLSGKKSAGFVNAVSKKLIGFDYKREVERIGDFYERISTLYSFETWMVKRWHKFYGDELIPLLDSLNRVAPLYVRVNLLKISVEDFLGLLKDKGIESELHPKIPHMVRIKGRVPVEEIPGYREGLFYVQDPASYLSALLLEPKPGELVLDVGAAPGGKTTAIASLTGNRAKIIAVDVSRKRMELLLENCRRLGVKNVETVITDISSDRNFIKKYAGKFDRILVDAPCSATGVIRRHPEGKWNKSLELIKRNQKIQRKLLSSSKELLKEGGRLVYSVCSLEREEGEENTDFALSLGFRKGELINSRVGMKIGRGELRVFPHRDGLDGFYYSLLS
ncbi:16S rRNA (cytosine967-C5)-methyltransferase [Balnearium lithotrophicum]|uniref:16S rRNA (cytosine(967)-C(5))-methyltransferase n=1 Tax=Balnearium lithotrophicum TaxID=223788 RepID=A0A521C295_9BACT|nr:16S rRNA (cytosine(967)-C(5))-methyltransferase RsmB [Balnearium lithotrophicum]SMO53606.1 16S rRNA (cytosine967-C5)-methyltransferase [Balnearium lithotrophicum]